MSTALFAPAGLRFLRQMKRNNNREWFLVNKPLYERELLEPMRQLVEEMDVRLATLAPEMSGNPKRSIFRIYRDVRFSKDKTPYKTHIACWFSHTRASHGVGSETHGAGAGYYVHVEPGNSLVAGGIWMPPRPSLQRIREALAGSAGDFERILKAKGFKARFGGLNEEHVLTRVPRGFDREHPAGRWLRYASHTVSAPLTDEQVLSPTLPQQVEKDFRIMLPLVRWINEALGYPTSARR